MFLLRTFPGRDPGLQVALRAGLASLKGCWGETADDGLAPPLPGAAFAVSWSQPREVGLWRPHVTGDAESGPLWGGSLVLGEKGSL